MRILLEYLIWYIIMQSLIDNQRRIHDNLYEKLENLMLNFENIDQIDDYNNLRTIADRIRIMNKNIEYLVNECLEIQIILKNNNYIKDKKLIEKLNEEEEENNKIKKLLPFLLLINNLSR